MSLRLSAHQQTLLDGSAGAATAQAMRMLVAVGSAMGAVDLVPIASAHVVLDAFAMGQPGVDWVHALRTGGGRCVVPTTINAISYDRRIGSSDSEFDRWQQRMLDDFEAMGALATCTCNPFNQGVVPLFGEHLSWSESATTAYLNSVLGARSNREGATAIASALTGLTPRYGMHLDQARCATVHLHVDCYMHDETDFNLLGALIARRAGDDIPVITGMPRPGIDEMFGFAASFAIMANLPMFHVVGMTPEAPTLEQACGGRQVGPPVVVSAADLADQRARLEDAGETQIGLVTVGAPHASLRQIRAVADALGERKVRSSVNFMLTTNAGNFALARACGLLDRLERAGVTVTADRMCFGCDLGARKYGDSVVLATNSVKAALSAPGTRGVRVRYGALDDCVEAAVNGRWRAGR
jgi:predicted aconitase